MRKLRNLKWEKQRLDAHVQKEYGQSIDITEKHADRPKLPEHSQNLHADRAKLHDDQTNPHADCATIHSNPYSPCLSHKSNKVHTPTFPSPKARWTRAQSLC